MTTTELVLSQIKAGSRVRDGANLGGEVVAIWRDGVLVDWNNGVRCWIKAKWLHVEARG